NPVHADFSDDLQSRPGVFECRVMRRSIHEAVGRARVARPSHFKAKRILVCDSTGKAWLEFLAQVWTDVQIPKPWTAAEPLQHAAAGEVHIQFLNVNGNCSE